MPVRLTIENFAPPYRQSPEGDLATPLQSR